MEAVLMPPEHLKSEIGKRRQPMEEMNAGILGALLSRIPLRVSLDGNEVVRVILQFINFIDLQYSMEGNDRGTDDMAAIEALEEKNRQVLDILLNGIVERRG